MPTLQFQRFSNFDEKLGSVVTDDHCSLWYNLHYQALERWDKENILWSSVFSVLKWFPDAGDMQNSFFLTIRQSSTPSNQSYWLFRTFIVLLTPVIGFNQARKTYRYSIQEWRSSVWFQNHKVYKKTTQQQLLSLKIFKINFLASYFGLISCWPRLDLIFHQNAFHSNSDWAEDRVQQSRHAKWRGVCWWLMLCCNIIICMHQSSSAHACLEKSSSHLDPMPAHGWYPSGVDTKHWLTAPSARYNMILHLKYTKCKKFFLED